MLFRPLRRHFPSLLLGMALMVPVPGAEAAPLDADACNRLRTERQALTVLGVDKYFDKGAEWAKTNLTVADLNLVKRYLDVFEQLKFRCEKIIAVIEQVEKDDDEETAEGVPPMPQRNAARPAKAAAPAALPASASTPASPASGSAPATAAPNETEVQRLEGNSTEIVKSPGKRPTNASAVQLGPRKDAPAQ